MGAMHWKLILILIGGISFCISSGAFLFVKIILRPKSGQAWEENHWEFEDQDPGMKRYDFWSRISFIGVVISMLLIFIGISV
jgi:hypothetical protein